MKQTKTFLAAAMLFGGTLVMACTLISTPQADSAALAAVGGGTVVSSQLDQFKGNQLYDVKITNSTGTWDVYVNACTGKVVKVHQDK